MSDRLGNRASWVIFIALALSLTVYLGGYLATVKPAYSLEPRLQEHPNGRPTRTYYFGYRSGGTWAWRLFWPLEQIDRRLRPKAWPPGSTRGRRDVERARKL